MGLIDSVRGGIGAVNDWYETDIKREQARRYPETLNLEIQGKGLANNYQGQVNQWYAPNMQADIGLKGANTRNVNENTRLMPLDTLIKAQTASQQSSRFGASYEMARALNAMDPAARSAWIAQNQEPYNQMIADLGNKQNTNLITPQILGQYFPGMQMPNQQPNPMGGIAAPPPGMPPQPGGMQPTQPGQPNPGAPAAGLAAPMPPTAPAIPLGNQQVGRFKPSTPEQVAQVQTASEMAANNKLTTAATRRQMEGAVQVQKIVNDPGVINQAENASMYAGARGRGKVALDALSQKNPAAYEDYKAFTKTTMVLLENRIKTLDQMGGTDKQREELHGLYNKAMDSLTSNPAEFMTQFNKLREGLSVVAEGVQKSATPVFNTNRLEKYAPVGAAANAAPIPGIVPANQGKTVTIQSPDGKTWNIPQEKLDAAIKRGAKKVG